MALIGTFYLQSNYNNKFLCYIAKDSELHGFLQFSRDDPSLTSDTKFKFEKAETVDGLVNIRSIDNNKYWVGRLENDEYWIVAEADEPNEDQSSSSCTLFEIDKENPPVVRLRHVHLGKYVCLSKASLQFPLCIFAGSIDPDPDGLDVYFTFTMDKPGSTQPPLPPQYAFKGDNGKYLCVEVIEEVPYLKFSAKDANDSRVWFQCLTNDNSKSGHLKSKFNNEFWRCDPKWVHVNSTSRDPNTLFHFELIHDNSVALRVGNFYCQRYENGERNSKKMDCLIANAPEITPQAILHVKEQK